MRILEETKDYVIYYSSLTNYNNFGKIGNPPQIIHCCLIDKKTNNEFFAYGNSLKDDVCKIGKKLIKKMEEREMNLREILNELKHIYFTVAKFWNLQKEFESLNFNKQNNRLYNFIKTFPKKRRDYIVQNMYYLAFLGYGVEDMIKEINNRIR